MSKATMNSKTFILSLVFSAFFAYGQKNLKAGFIPNNEMFDNINSKSLNCVTGIFYKIRNPTSDKILKEQEDSGIYKIRAVADDSQTSDDMLFAFEEVFSKGGSQGSKSYIIRNRKSKRIIGLEPSSSRIRTFISNSQLTNETLFSLSSRGGNNSHFFIKSNPSGKLLNVTDADNKINRSLKVKSSPDDKKFDTHRFFILEPYNYKLKANITNFDYDKKNLQDYLDSKLVRNIVLSKTSVNNNAAGSAVEKISFTNKKAQNFMFGFEKSLDFFSCIKISAKIPSLEDIESEIRFDANFNSRKQASHSTEYTTTVERTYTIPPHHSVEISSIVEWVENLTVKFNADIEVEALTDRLDDQGNISTESVDPAAIRYYLSLQHFDTLIISGNTLPVIAKLKGIFTGSYGLKGKFEIN